MKTATRQEVFGLPHQEKLRLAQQLIASVTEIDEAKTFTDRERAILDERLREDEKTPAAAVPWPAVKRELGRSRETGGNFYVATPK